MSDTKQAARTDVTADLWRIIDEAIGMSDEMNDGPFAYCHDCGRRMVWDMPDRSMPVWMCPHCVWRRCQRAEEENQRLRAFRQAIITATDGDDDPEEVLPDIEIVRYVRVVHREYVGDDDHDASDAVAALLNRRDA